MLGWDTALKYTQVRAMNAIVHRRRPALGGLIATLAASLLLGACAEWPWQPAERVAAFAGTLRDATGKPVSGARVSVGEVSTFTDGDGRFVLKGLSVARDRWVLEARRPGYAPVSKVFDQGAEDTDVIMVETTVQTFDPGSAIVARDVRTACIGSPAADADWGAYPLARFPQVFDANGQRVTGALPSEARRVLGLVSDDQPCSSGFQVAIPAGSLVGAGGQPTRSQVQVELSTVDLYSPDGMPGDYTVASSAGPTYMESLGAGTVTVRSGDEALQLGKGTQARIAIPVDRTQLELGAKIPGSIPLLRYKPKTGEWQTIGEATLDRKQMAYLGTVEHLSEFNADVVRTNPACLRFDASGITGNFDLVITAPTSTGGYKQVTKSVAPDPAHPSNPNLHAIYNLPANAWVVLRAIKSGTPVGTWIVATGGPWGSGGAPTHPYAACGTTFALSETVGAGIAHNGATHRFGPLPKHVSFLVKTTGGVEDVYPVGGTDCSNCLYLFSLFDTGSNLVVLDNATRTLHGLSLTPGTAWDVDVRINGLSTLNASLFAPFGLPGTAGGAEAHSGELRIAPRNITLLEEEVRTNAAGTPIGGFVGVNYALIGAPVANKVVARIDYTNPVTRGPWTFGTPFIVTAPDIQFFESGASGIPSPTLTLFVEGFGSASALTTGTTDQRHFLQNVTFTEGASNVYDDQTPASPVRFLYDSATTFTVISQAMASTLGATPASPNPAAECKSTDTSNFVQIDSVTVVGMNASNQLATYQVSNAEVCVDVAGTVITTNYPNPANPTGPPLTVDAVIGSNLFDQADVLWNGPERTLGILP